jgi:hypothetical protein
MPLGSPLTQTLGIAMTSAHVSEVLSFLILLSCMAAQAQSADERMRIAVQAAGSPEGVLERVAMDQGAEFPIRPAPNIEIQRVTREQRTLTYQTSLLLVPSKRAFDSNQMQVSLALAHVCNSEGVGVLIRNYGAKVVYKFSAVNGEQVFVQIIDAAACATMK